MPARPRSPRWYGLPVRVMLITFIGTLLCFALSLLFAIVGTVVLAKMRGVDPDMTVAYRSVALPVSLVAGGVIFVLMMVNEIRRLRQVKALSSLEKMN